MQRRCHKGTFTVFSADTVHLVLCYKWNLNLKNRKPETLLNLNLKGPTHSMSARFILKAKKQ